MIWPDKVHVLDIIFQCINLYGSSSDEIDCPSAYKIGLSHYDGGCFSFAIPKYSEHTADVLNKEFFRTMTADSLYIYLSHSISVSH